MKTLRIAMVVDNELVSDVRVLNEAYFLLSEGHDVSVLCFDHGRVDKEEYNLLEGIDVHFFEKPLWWKNKLRPLMSWLPVYGSSWKNRVTDFCLEVKPDILHIHDLYMAASIDKRAIPCPVVLDLHENWPEAILSYEWATTWPNRILVNPKKWKSLEFDYLRKADGIIVLSEYFKKDVLDRFPKLKNEHITVYPNVPFRDLWDQTDTMPVFNEGDMQDKTVLFYFGVIAIRRGILILLDALEKKDVEDFHLLLIGPIEKKDKPVLEPIIDQLTKKGKLSWVPWIDLKDLPSYLNQADICLSPIEVNAQHDSGVANKVFQYMYFKKPVLASASAAQKKLIQDEKCGWIFEEFSSEGLIEGLESALLDQANWKNMGEAGHKAIVNKYRAGIQGQNILSLYQELLNQKSE